MTRVQKFDHRILTPLKIPVTTAFFWLSLLGLLSSATLCYYADNREARSTRSPSAMLVGQRVYTSRDAARHSRGSGTPVYRCVRVGMGSPPSHSPGEWCLTTRETTLHINQFEMMALLNALLAIKKQLTGMTMQLMSDNATVVSYLRKQGVTVYVSPSSTGSALLARDVTWDRPNIDPFATHLNHRLPVFVSPMADPQAVDVDALSIPWNGMYAYASPHSWCWGEYSRKYLCPAICSCIFFLRVICLLVSSSSVPCSPSTLIRVPISFIQKLATVSFTAIMLSDVISPL